MWAPTPAPLVVKHLVLIPDVFNVIPELQDSLQDQLLPSEWQLFLLPNCGFIFTYL